MDLERSDHLIETSRIVRHARTTEETNDLVVVVRYTRVNENVNFIGGVKCSNVLLYLRFASLMMIHNEIPSGLIGNRPSGHATFNDHDQRAGVIE